MAHAQAAPAQQKPAQQQQPAQQPPDQQQQPAKIQPPPPAPEPNTPTVPQAAQEVTLTQAIDEATGTHPNIEQARQDLKVAEAQRKQAHTHFFPILSTSAGAQLWDDKITFSMGGGGGGNSVQLPPPQTPYEKIIAGIFNAPPTTVRSQFTWSVSLTITEPLGPLYTIYHAYYATIYGEDAARTQVDQATRDQARQAAVSYFRVLQARSALDTNQQSVAQLNAQVKNVDALVQAGVAQKADLLRIQVALAAAQQQVSQSKANLKLARSALAVAIGRDPQNPVGVQGPANVNLPTLQGDLADAIDQATKTRPELQQLKLRMQQADEGVDIQKGDYIPQLVALGQYQHQEGQGLSGNNNLFVGLALDWDIWKWGARSDAVDEAQAQRVKLDYVYTQARRQIGLQVKKAWYDLQSALETYQVAEQSVEQAKEAFRVETARYQAGESTPTDLLSAQSALTEAQNNRNAALYQALIQNAELIYAIGQPLSADRLLPGEGQ